MFCFKMSGASEDAKVSDLSTSIKPWDMPAILLSLLPQFLYIVAMRVGRDSREGTSAVHQVSGWKQSVFLLP